METLNKKNQRKIGVAVIMHYVLIYGAPKVSTVIKCTVLGL